MIIRRLHNNLAEVGHDQSIKFSEKRKIKLVNIASLVCIPWLIMPTIRILMGFNWHGCLIDYFVALGSISSVYLNHKRKYQLSRFVISFCNYIGLVSLSIIYGRFLGTHVVLFAWLICNLYFFDNKRVIAFFSMLIGVSIIVLEFFFVKYGAIFPEERITIFYFSILVLMTFFVIFAITNMYKNDSMLYSNAIEETNEALEQMNEEIIIQNEVLSHQKDCIDEQKQRIELSFNATRDSIRYALNIQSAILKNEHTVKLILPNSFIVYRPKDIVSGDFYWINKIDDKIIVVVVDCTGHGVPGAFMTIVANSLLNEIVLTNRITDPGEILKNLDNKLLNTFQINIDTFGSGLTTIRDGMDVSICCIESQCVLFAGAKRPLFYSINNELFEEKGSRHAVGATTQSDKDFVSCRIETQPGMMFYLFSDGVTDQFNNDNNKRYSSRQFRSLLTDIHILPITHKKKEILRSMYGWQGETPQTDDIVIVGFQV